MPGEDGLWGTGAAAGGALGAGGADPRGVSSRSASQATGSGTTRSSTATTRTARDETTVRGKLRFDAVRGLARRRRPRCTSISTTATTCSRPTIRCTTKSDRPGRDAQRIRRRLGGRERRCRRGAARVHSSAVAESDIDYSFDGDWGNDAYWGEFAPYDYYTSFERRRRTLSQDLRLLSDATATDAGFGWVAGLYALKLDGRRPAARRVRRRALRPAALERLRRDQPCGLR